MNQTGKLKAIILIIAIAVIITIATKAAINKIKENAKKKPVSSVLSDASLIAASSEEKNTYLSYPTIYTSGANANLKGSVILEIDKNGNFTGTKTFLNDLGNVIAPPSPYVIDQHYTIPPASTFFALPDNGDPLASAYVRVNPTTTELEYDVINDAFDAKI